MTAEPTDQELFDDLYRLREEVDRTYPVAKDVIREGQYSISKYRKRWDSVARARVAAGMHPPPRETIRDHLRERAAEKGHLYTDSKAVADAIGFETRTVGRMLAGLETDSDTDAEGGDLGFEVSRRPGGTNSRVLWEVSES